MRVWIFYPPLRVMSGGCLVLTQIARQIQTLGRLGGLVYWETPPRGPEFEGLPCCKADQAPLCAGDLFIVPDGWPNALALGFRAACRCLLYCQNWAYLFHGLPQNVQWRDMPVDFLAVSAPVAWHLKQVLGKRAAIIRPALDPAIFYSPTAKPAGRPRVAVMPRKNKGLIEQVRRIFEERQPGVSLEWVPIDGQERTAVADILRTCHIFLATGFPEGFALPPLEAMSCGCLCVGFTGFGGWDYMRQMEPEGYHPHVYALRAVPWQGNGFWVGDGDVLGAAVGLEWALAALQRGLNTDGARTAAAYTLKAQEREICAALSLDED